MHEHLPLVCFIVCDGGPAQHFAEFTKKLLTQDNLRINIYASKLAFSKFQDLSRSDGIRLLQFTLDKLKNEDEQTLATHLIDDCAINGAQTIIVDIANSFSIQLQKAFHKLDILSRKIRFWSYYDNPEGYVPGGYSIRSGEMIESSENILFANMNLATINTKLFSVPNVKINLQNKDIQGIGYYPVETAEKLYRQRESERKVLRDKYNWASFKYIFVYFGGNNEAYYEQAFPAFLLFLSSIDKELGEDILLIIHQHPAAKVENRDGLLFQKWLLENRSFMQIILSPLTSDEAQMVADGALYYQTSMSPQFTLIGLPVMQVAHKVYEDILVKHKLCELATNAIEFMNGLKVLKEKSQSPNSIQNKKLIYDAIGYHFNWLQRLQNIVLCLQ